MVELVQTLCARLDEQREMIDALSARVEQLEDRLAMNSTNSSKPPSSDELAPPKPKPKSLRTNKGAGRKPGGQKGHPGTTLCWVDDPDRVVLHDPPRECEGCAMDLERVELSHGWERRQLIDAPPVALQVTEHRARRKKCLGCGRLNTASFPEEMSARGVSYGPRVKALSVYLMGYQLLPFDRTRELLCALFGPGPAPGAGTIHSALERAWRASRRRSRRV